MGVAIYFQTIYWTEIIVVSQELSGYLDLCLNSKRAQKENQENCQVMININQK